MLYGCESWTPYRRHIAKLDQFHLRCLRKIVHIKQQNHIQNTTVLERAQISGIETNLLAAQFRWTGHAIRMEEHRIPKRLLQPSNSMLAALWWTIQTLQRHTKGQPEVVWHTICRTGALCRGQTSMAHHL